MDLQATSRKGSKNEALKTQLETDCGQPLVMLRTLNTMGNREQLKVVHESEMIDTFLF